MAGATSTFAVDNTANYNVVANTFCYRVLVQENYDSATAPTQDLIQTILPGGAAIKVPKGTPAVYTMPYGVGLISPGTVVGTIRTSAGSITVQQVESGQI